MKTKQVIHWLKRGTWDKRRGTHNRYSYCRKYINQKMLYSPYQFDVTCKECLASAHGAKQQVPS